MITTTIVRLRMSRNGDGYRTGVFSPLFCTDHHGHWVASAFVLSGLGLYYQEGEAHLLGGIHIRIGINPVFFWVYRQGIPPGDTEWRIDFFGVWGNYSLTTVERHGGGTGNPHAAWYYPMAAVIYCFGQMMG